nr:immunoglobulin light chain junction region [Macaca mulatta]MOV35379.1 immunoglobulin light chain junction region [Macaca mulatta]MOW07858.1 immunoglobulin light chain junction region [Macaca mulatta]MOW09056.1 immunoglobulin light chain junction region [Macaca mulatta]MOW09679.1 immunoglobulin light chain junction region [Macaca mulatta]
CLQGYSIPWTF